MAHWHLSIPVETDRTVRMYLARTGCEKKGDLSKFVIDSVRREIFDQTVKQIQDRNVQYDQNEILNVINGAVKRTHTDRS